MPATTNLMLRQDTLLGVCEGLGEDFGFNPNWLRVALGSVLLFSPMIAVGTYLLLGLVVMLGRVGWPSRVAAGPVAADAPPAPVVADNDEGAVLAKVA